jgi:hypothetical protein
MYRPVRNITVILLVLQKYEMKQLVSIFFSLKNMKDVQRLNEKLTVSS